VAAFFPRRALVRLPGPEDSSPGVPGAGAVARLAVAALLCLAAALVAIAETRAAGIEMQRGGAANPAACIARLCPTGRAGSAVTR